MTYAPKTKPYTWWIERAVRVVLAKIYIAGKSGTVFAGFSILLETLRNEENHGEGDEENYARTMRFLNYKSCKWRSEENAEEQRCKTLLYIAQFMDNEMREKGVESGRGGTDSRGQANTHNRSLECME